MEVEHLQAGLRRGRREALARIREHARERRRRDAVDVLSGIEPIAHGALVHLRRQRAEQQAAVDGRVGVHLVDDGLELCLRSVGRQLEAAH